MAVKKRNKNLTKQKGQALFEFLFFIPFSIALYFIVTSFGDSLNVSLNQQKVTRGYFYGLILGNSFLPRRDAYVLQAQNLTSVGMWYVGWRLRFENAATGQGQPLAPCLKIPEAYGQESNETCYNPIEESNTELSQYIRVYTAYGACTATYIPFEGGHVHRPDLAGSIQGCQLLD